MTWIQITLPIPQPSGPPSGYVIKYDRQKGYSLRLGSNSLIEVVPWKHDYEAMLKALYDLLEMQKSGIKLWLNPRSNNICTNKD